MYVVWGDASCSLRCSGKKDITLWGDCQEALSWTYRIDMDSGGPVFVPAALIGRLLGAINRWAAIRKTVHGHMIYTY